MRNTKTSTVNGYRWLLSEWGGVYKLSAQQRCIADNGKPYFRYAGAKAEFDTPEARALFMQNYSAKQWAA